MLSHILISVSKKKILLLFVLIMIIFFISKKLIAFVFSSTKIESEKNTVRLNFFFENALNDLNWATENTKCIRQFCDMFNLYVKIFIFFKIRKNSVYCCDNLKSNTIVLNILYSLYNYKIIQSLFLNWIALYYLS